MGKFELRGKKIDERVNCLGLLAATREKLAKTPGPLVNRIIAIIPSWLATVAGRKGESRSLVNFQSEKTARNPRKRGDCRRIGNEETECS